ncbi:coiled-coil domain-containing protein 88B isoform X3 [Papio anubis]|uniref:coiled-coil domain-containing protein 88B isoform X3 n=1 Tax=Papio anubis TaxID=9555 RepID=UPI0012AE2994|nr:coiled-coil domain-containing protein 88B isoform X3 [Papio anubis]
MEGGKGPRLRDFLSGSLATWALGLAGLVGEAEESEGEEEEEEEERPLWLEKRFLRLSDGALLLRVLGIIAPTSRGGPRMLRGLDGPAAWRVWNLNHLWSRLRDFYQEELQLLILSPPPDLQTLGFDPLSEEAVEQLEGVLRLLLGASVQCEHRELFIRHIQGLSLEVQSELAAAIQEVTQPGTGVVLALSGPEPGELTLAELEMLSRSLMGTLSRLARERDLGAQRLAELLLEREPLCLRPEAPSRAPAEGPSHHLALQLANAKAQLRRLRQELEEKAELLLDSQAEVQGLEVEIRRLRQEAQALSGQAKRAELYREEVEALRERAGRLPRLQEELRRCSERLQAAEACKSQLEEERVLSGVLEASKALLEEQLEAARERCARLHETQRENLLLRTRLGEAHAELDSLRHQVDQLAEENVELELELQRSLEPPPGSPGEAPLPGAAPSLQDEVREAEAGRLRTLERENQELRGLLQVLQGQPGGQELEKAVVRGKELGARLEHLQRELEQAALERQEFLREQESQHQRYQGLEQRLEAELQAAATSKEEALMELKTRALQLEEELFQLRQGPAGLGPKEHAEPRLVETQNVRLIEVERSNATLVAEKAALQGQLQHLEGQLGSLQGRAQELLLQSQRAQEHSSRLQAEKSVLEIKGQELHRKLEVLEEEVQSARRSQEETRGQQQALLRDHEALAQLQRRQEAELEGLLVRHRDLKANMRALELAHRELQGRHEQLQAQRASVEAQEVALLAERERLMQDGHRQRGLEEELRRLQSEHDRAQLLLAEVSRERGELQGERGELRGRLARLELERAQLEMQSQQLRESNQQLDLSACRLTTQCELLTQLRSAQEEENRQLLTEVQALSRENRELLERSLESRDHLHREQREYLEQLNALRREKQKLVEKIMDQYRVLEPGPLPRTKKGSWLADKVKRLMRPRRRSFLRAGRQMGQGSLPRHPCAGPRAPSACGMRPWQAGSGGNSAQGSRWAEALSHSALGTPLGNDSDSAVQGPWGHPSPTAKDLVWDGRTPLRPSRSTKQMPTERAPRYRNRRNVPSPRPSASDTMGTAGSGVQPSCRWSVSGGPRQPKSSGSQGPQGESLDKEVWAWRSSMVGAGARRWSWDKCVDRGDSWSPRVALGRDSGFSRWLPLRQRSLGDPPAEGGWQE